jgi:hypothetical protein
VVSRSEQRRAAGDWLGRHYPDPPVPYDTDRALDEYEDGELRAEGMTAPDALAWVLPSRAAADDYARAARTLYGRRQLSYVNTDGQVIAVTDVRGDPVYPEGDQGD